MASIVESFKGDIGGERKERRLKERLLSEQKTVEGERLFDCD